MDSFEDHTFAQEPSEQTPLLECPVRQPQTSQNGKSRPWPTIYTLAILFCLILSILSVGFFAPATARQYAAEAVSIDFTSLTLESYTRSGLSVHLAATLCVDAEKVQNIVVRTLGRIGTTVFKIVKAESTTIHFYLPDYEGVVIANATLPNISFDVQDGQPTQLNIIVIVEPSSPAIISTVISDFINGNLGSLRIYSQGSITLRSGVLHVDTNNITREFVLKGMPTLPLYTITNFKISEQEYFDQRVLVAAALVAFDNPYPLQLRVPPLNFTISIPGCKPGTLFKIALAFTSEFMVTPNNSIEISLSAIIHSLPNELINTCDGTSLSPVDSFVSSYLLGGLVVVYVSGKISSMNGNTPTWMVDFLSKMRLPVPLLGHHMDNVIQSFNLSGVSFQLPPSTVDPSTLEALLRLSAVMEAYVAIPSEVDFAFAIDRLRVTATISYEQTLFGTFDFPAGLPVESSSQGKFLRIKCEIIDVPINISNYTIFEKVAQNIVLGTDQLNLGVSGNVDVGITLGLGSYAMRNLPVSANITINHIPEFRSMPLPTTKDIIVETSTSQYLVLNLRVDAFNPTPWSANIPYSNFLIRYQNVTLGHVTTHPVNIVTGKNELNITIMWNPDTYGGAAGIDLGHELISEYISGYNVSLILKAHEKTFPSMPRLSKALSLFNVTIPVPRLAVGNPNDDNTPHFIKSATMHVLSSTADFYLQNPFPHNFITIVKLNGTAKYNGTTLGTISHNDPFMINPGYRGSTMTPRLPVKWHAGSIGYEAMKKAIGGNLKIHAESDCQLVIGDFLMDVLYNASDPVGAHIRL